MCHVYIVLLTYIYTVYIYIICNEYYAQLLCAAVNPVPRNPAEMDLMQNSCAPRIPRQTSILVRTFLFRKILVLSILRPMSV